MNLKKLPQEEKPRERLLKYGKNNVSNNELIEIILKSGTKRAGIKEISHNGGDSIHFGDETILNVSVPNNRISKYKN